MRLGKVITLLGASLASVLVAGPALTADLSKPFAIAQQDQNPTNDPEVQRGINERNEQERQRKIQECYNERTAHMNPAPTKSFAASIRRECEFGIMSSGVRAE